MRILDMNGLFVGQRVTNYGNRDLQPYVGMVVKIEHGNYLIHVKHPVDGVVRAYHYGEVEIYD